MAFFFCLEEMIMFFSRVMATSENTTLGECSQWVLFVFLLLAVFLLTGRLSHFERVSGGATSGVQKVPHSVGMAGTRRPMEPFLEGVLSRWESRAQSRQRRLTCWAKDRYWSLHRRTPLAWQEEQE